MKIDEHDAEALTESGGQLGRRHLDEYGVCACSCWRCWDPARRVCECGACNRDKCPDPHEEAAR